MKKIDPEDIFVHLGQNCLTRDGVRKCCDGNLYSDCNTCPVYCEGDARPAKQLCNGLRVLKSKKDCTSGVGWGAEDGVHYCCM